MKKEKFIVLTLGCSKNLVDSEYLISQLESNGFSFTENINEASTCIINTCGFIKPSVEESLQIILQVVELKSKRKLNNLIVAGCMSQRFNDELQNQFPEVDFITGVDSSEAILHFLKRNDELKYNLIGERKLLTPKHYAYLKISEGCNRECSFCAIPLIRGKHKSKPLDKILEEAKFLALQGVKELILVSQDSSSYGIDLYSKPKLAELLSNLSDINDFRWIRLMYTYPMGFPDEALDVIAERDNICKYVDIPLQHISDRVLKSMRRGTTRKSIEVLLEKIRSKIPNVAIRTTFIVGYPNETEKDFRELLEFIQDFKFDRIGVFTYSSEDGTYSFQLGDPIPIDEKNLRRDELMKKQMEISYNLNRNLIGKKILVLVDEFDGKRYIARTEKDAPEVDNNVLIKNPKKRIEIGSFVEVVVETAKSYDLFGKAMLP
ncbi:MAG: 30S ribosomal protein S12 methylthiotransferase RimO [Candidatus Kapaibacteriales bacterium]